jgi:hypothetical protein
MCGFLRNVLPEAQKSLRHQLDPRAKVVGGNRLSGGGMISVHMSQRQSDDILLALGTGEENEVITFCGAMLRRATRAPR